MENLTRRFEQLRIVGPPKRKLNTKRTSRKRVKSNTGMPIKRGYKAAANVTTQTVHTATSHRRAPRRFRRPPPRVRVIPPLNIWSGTRLPNQPVSPSTRRSQGERNRNLQMFETYAVRRPDNFGAFYANRQTGHQAILDPRLNYVGVVSENTPFSIVQYPRSRFRFAWGTVNANKKKAILREMNRIYKFFNATNANRRNFETTITNLNNPNVSLQNITRLRNKLHNKIGKLDTFKNAYNKWKQNKTNKPLFQNMITKLNALDRIPITMPQISTFYRNYRNLVNSNLKTQAARNIALANSRTTNFNNLRTRVKRGLRTIHLTKRRSVGLPVP